MRNVARWTTGLVIALASIGMATPAAQASTSTTVPAAVASTPAANMVSAYRACTTAKTLRWTPSGGNQNRIRVPGVTNPSSEICNLKTGADNYGVQSLQGALNSCYNKSLTIDGVFGANTKKALINVQSKVGVTADGVFGPVTARTMKWRAEVTGGASKCKTVPSWTSFWR